VVFKLFTWILVVLGCKFNKTLDALGMNREKECRSRLEKLKMGPQMTS
jgi:hypothetical protein